MLFKLDENLGPLMQRVIEAAGHDCSSVFVQKLSGKSDEVIASVCKHEARCLVTLDMDFANPMRFSPSDTAGIVVLRPGDSRSRSQVLSTVQALLTFVQQRSVAGKLVIVEPTRVRMYPRDTPD